MIEIEKTIERMNELLLGQYKYKKVLFLTDNNSYDFAVAKFKNEDVNAIFLIATEYNKESAVSLISNELSDVDLIVGVGDEKLCNFARFVSHNYNINVTLFVKGYFTIDLLLEDVVMEENGFLRLFSVKTCENVFIYAEDINQYKRRNIVEMLLCLISKISFVLDKEINAYIYKKSFEGFNQTFLKEFYKELFDLLKCPTIVNLELIKRIFALNIKMANFLRHANYEKQDKETIFACNYKFFDASENVNLNELRIIGAIVMNKMYLNFFQKIDRLSYAYFDIEKRVRVFDKYFSGVNCDICLSEIADENKLKYILNRYKVKFIKKVEYCLVILQALMNKCLDFYEDGGYEVFKSFNSQNMLRSVYFVPDIIKGNCIIKMIRDYGLMDFEI